MAITKGDVDKLKEEKAGKEVVDRRNLYLAKEGGTFCLLHRELEAFIEHLIPRAPRPYFIVWVQFQWSGRDQHAL